MKLLATSFGSFLLAVTVSALAGEVLFEDNFNGKLGEGWTWVREHREAWRVSGSGLEVRVEPRNMWGGANNAKNVLARPVSIAAGETLEVLVTIMNQPAEQYEQVDLVWYYADSHMVKIQECERLPTNRPA